MEMKFVKRFLALIVLMSLSGVGLWAEEFTFTFSNTGGDAATGVLTVVDQGNGSYLATLGTFDLTASSTPAVAVGDYGLIAGGPGPTYSPSGAFLFDNLLYPGQTPVLDTYGLLFGNITDEINIWGNSTASDYTYYVWDSSSSSYVVAAGGTGTFDLTTPEPVSMLLFGTFLSLAGGLLGRKKGAL